MSTYALGKRAAAVDTRNLKAAAILRRAVRVPAYYDVDAARRLKLPLPMFANDQWGDCVIAGRAHQTLRFETLEQGTPPPITDDDVVNEYLRQTGGQDSGLVVLDSLRAWRKDGWAVAGTTYKIKAFAQVDHRSPSEVRRAIFADVGVGVGLALPEFAEDQFAAGKPWTLPRSRSAGRNPERGSWGGHYVYCKKYTPAGPVCITWGREQPMTWGFWAAYCDEAYAIFDSSNTFKTANVDAAAIEQFLEGHQP